jgi:S1-C subfamily serine protease
MPPGSTCVPNPALASVVAVALLMFAVTVRAGASDDASVGYETIRPALVKVWAFDRNGRPSESGTGVIVEAGPTRALVLTATHVVAGAASIRIDVSRDVHDLVARVERTGPRDLTLLEVERGGLRAAHFAPRTHNVVEGNLVAVAGYVKNDELIGIVGQEPRILFPGTVSSRPDDGRYLELENVHIEEGLSGGAVFDPSTGDVLGIITARTTDRRGGFADSGAAVVLPFLAAAM